MRDFAAWNGNLDAGDIGLLLVLGHYSASEDEAQILLSALRDLGPIAPVVVDVNSIEKTHHYAGCSMVVISGWQALEPQVRIISEFRDAYPYIPIVVQGRDSTPRVRMMAFTNGADNFVSLDCTRAELTAKMRRLLRLARKDRMMDAPVHIRDLKIWPEQKVVLKNGRRVQLSERELDTLIYLAKQHPESVSRRTLEREVFGFRADPGTNVVAVHVHRLRKKIAADKDMLRTVPGGYRLA